MRAPTALLTALSGTALFSGTAAVPSGPACVIPGPEYYAIELVGTRNVPGLGVATGRADVSVAATSPFSVSVAADGSYRYDIDVQLENLRAPRRGVLVAWVATRELDAVERIGVLDAQFRVTGSTSWNKFLVIVSLEPEDDPKATRWTGPVAFRGMSRSGMMHTMAGHGAFQQENCAAYGYDD